MPDDADWNPADIRYNTIRWMIQPGSGIAVGPSRAKEELIDNKNFLYMKKVKYVQNDGLIHP